MDGRTIRLTANSAIPFFNYTDLYHNDPQAKPQAMVASVRSQNPDAEFILLMSFQPNPKWRSLDPMPGYLEEMKAMEGDGIAVADMWSMHGHLLHNKTYWDMTGNHVNHPNDFLVRVYAQTVLATLGLDEQ